MKKIGVVLVLFLIVLSSAVVLSEDDIPTTPVGEEDVEKLQDIIDQLPFDDSGETDFSKYKPFRTRAEERINSINSWLDNNASWMRYLFHMRPQVSFLFALNCYFILFFFLIFVMNAEGLWFFIESLGRARLFGSAVFVAFGAIGLYVGLAHVFNNFILYIWHILADSAIWLAIIVVVLVIVLGFFGLVSINSIIASIGKYFAWKKEYKEKLEDRTNRGALNAFLEQVGKK